jgi:WD40 repeat protein
VTSFGSIRRRQFVAIATAKFDVDPSYPELPEIADEVELVSAWLTDERLGERRFTQVHAELAADPELEQIEACLRNPPRDERWNGSDAAVVYITGHGDIPKSGPPEHYLVLNKTDGTRLSATGLATDVLLGWLASTDIAYLLVIIDVCFAGQAAEKLVGSTDKHWLILPSARKDQGAEPGALTKAISGYLRTAQEFNTNAPYLTVGVFVDAVNELLPPGQKIEKIYKGRRPEKGKDRDHDRDRHVCLPNPSYKGDDLVQIDPTRQALALPKDLLSLHNRVRGHPPSADSPGWLFTGRKRLMRDLIQAVGKPGITLVTGSAGSGKSTALSRLVTLSDPDFRRSYEPELAGVPADMLPPRAGVDVALSARGLSNRQVVTQISHDLGILAHTGSWDDPVRANMEALSEFIAGRNASVTVVIDALDEAEDPADLVRSLLGPLRQKHPERLCLLVGVRSPGGDYSGTEDLVGAGEPLYDLMAAVPEAWWVKADDDLRWIRRDFTTFVHNILTNTANSPYRNAGRTTVNRVAEVISTLAGRSYLMARMAANSAAKRPDVIAPEDPAWLDELKGGVLGVFSGDLQASLPSPGERRRGVALLRAIAFARGPGLPRHHVWPKVATAVDASDGAGRSYGDTDVKDLLKSRLNAYLMTDQQDDLTVYRIIHDELRDILRYRWRELLKEPTLSAIGDGTPEAALPRADEAEIRAVQARISRELRNLADVEPTVAANQAVPPYIRRHFAEHALDGGVLDKYVPVSFLPYVDLTRLRATAGASPDRRQLEQNVPWLPIIWQVTHLWNWNRPASNAAAIGMWAALNGTELPGSAAEPGPVGGPWRVQWAIKPPDMGNVLGHHKEIARATATAELSGGPIAVTGGEGGRLHVWDLSTGAHYRDREPIDTRAGDDQDQTTLSVATAQLPTGRTVAVTGNADGTVRVWDLGSGRALGDPIGAGNQAIEAVTTAVLPGKRVVVTAADASGVVRTWDLTNHEPVGVQVPCGPGMALGIATALVGEQVLGLASGEDSGLELWDLATGIRVGERLTGHPLAEQPATGTVQGGRVIAAVVLEGREVALTGNGDGLLFWDLRERAPISRRLRGSDGSIRSLAAAQIDGRGMAVTGGSSTVQVWDLTAGETVGELLTGHDGSVEALAITRPRNGTAFAVSASRDKSVRIWDVPGAALSPRRSSQQIGIVEAVATARSADGLALAITCSQTAVQVWDLERGGDPTQLTDYDSPVVSVAAAELSQGVLVTAGHWDGWISAWWADGGPPVSCAEIGDLGAAASLATARLAGRRLVTLAGGWDGDVRVWDPFAGSMAGEPLRGHTDVVVAVATATTADGRTLVISGSKDGRVRIQDLSAHFDPGLPALRPPVDAAVGEEVASLTVAMLAGGRRCVVVGGAGGTVRLLDLLDGAVIGQPWHACSGAVQAVAAAQLADGRAVVFTGGEESLVQTWDAGSGEPTGTALPVPGPVMAMAFQTKLSSLVVGGTGVAVARLRHGGR